MRIMASLSLGEITGLIGRMRTKGRVQGAGDAPAPEATTLPTSGLEPKRITLAQVLEDADIRTVIEYADLELGVMGYTEHGLRHGTLTGTTAQHILEDLGYPPREAELAAI